MSEINNQNSPVIIVGAGLSGLACAIKLEQAKIPYLLLEQSDQVGGRIKTTLTRDGYRLDQGFQVLLTSYPELKNFIDLKKLHLKYFNSSSLIYIGSNVELLSNPLLYPSKIIKELISNLVSFKDKFLVLKLILRTWLSFDNKLIKTMTTDQYLKEFGFSSHFINLFWKPFLSGVFLDLVF